MELTIDTLMRMESNCMTIKDILTITGGNTKVMIFSTDKEDRYIRLWYGVVDDIHFPYVPYGHYDVEHMTVINEEDILQLHFEYPEFSENERKVIGKKAVGHPYPTDWIEKLFIKYRDWEYVREILNTKTKEEVYNEVRIIPDEEIVDDEITIIKNNTIDECINLFADWFGYNYQNQGYYRLLKQLKDYNSNPKEYKERIERYNGK